MSDLEEELVEGLSKVLLEEEVEGLDEDLVAHISGILSAQIHEGEGNHDMEELFEEVLNPFLESVGCPEHFVEQAQTTIRSIVDKHQTVSSGTQTSSTTTRKLTQGVVSMSSELEKDQNSNLDLWTTTNGVKAMANDLIDAHQDKSSAKEKRKARKAEAEYLGRELSMTDWSQRSGLVDLQEHLFRMIICRQITCIRWLRINLDKNLIEDLVVTDRNIGALVLSKVFIAFFFEHLHHSDSMLSVKYR